MAYGCAKAAAISFSESLRAELGAGSGIKITTIAPGLMRTGSHVNARFKGQHEREAAWFSVAASAPLLAMNAERAAAQIVQAIRRGSSEKILSLPANVLARVHGLFPDLTGTTLGAIDCLLPQAEDGESREVTGLQLAANQGSVLRALTSLGRLAGSRLNQPAS
jgi:NAD(P)-dependent dehydrogenase (short-subunit alcohol dehydrogenase family)